MAVAFGLIALSLGVGVSERDGVADAHFGVHLYYALGQTRGPSSLDVVCWALGLTSPKEDMDGSMVASTYEKGDIASIALYNAGDVRATTGVYQRVRDRVLRFRDDW